LCGRMFVACWLRTLFAADWFVYGVDTRPPRCVLSIPDWLAELKSCESRREPASWPVPSPMASSGLQKSIWKADRPRLLGLQFAYSMPMKFGSRFSWRLRIFLPLISDKFRRLFIYSGLVNNVSCEI
jgi:hypothetical protein